MTPLYVAFVVALVNGQLTGTVLGADATLEKCQHDVSVFISMDRKNIPDGAVFTCKIADGQIVGNPMNAPSLETIHGSK
ncbi:MAG: hypothetical protein ACREQ5_19430 [Candidatus Dormibacteria bacterium]